MRSNEAPVVVGQELTDRQMPADEAERYLELPRDLSSGHRLFAPDGFAKQRHDPPVAYSVGTTPVLLSEDNYGRAQVRVYNNGAATVYWGGPDVSTSNGIPIPAAGFQDIPQYWVGQLWAVSAAGTNDVRVVSAPYRRLDVDD